MRFRKHAYRHALQPLTTRSPEPIWISDDILTSTFRRFVDGQRRHQTRVPGPLEARRRLAKRRNTALAGAWGPADDTVACLFGKDGRQHLKWVDVNSRSRDNGVQAVDILGFAPPPPPPPPGLDTMFPFFEPRVGRRKEFNAHAWADESDRLDDKAIQMTLDTYLDEHWKIADMKTFLGLLDVNLFSERALSERIFQRLLLHSVHTKGAAVEVAAFLDDLSMNTRGTRNYALAVQHLVTREANLKTWDRVLGAVNRALSLGLVPSDQLCAIVESLTMKAGSLPAAVLADYYRGLWDAIGRCDVFNHTHLRSVEIEAFLDGLWRIDACENALLLAKTIILVTHGSRSEHCQWVPRFVVQWVDYLSKSETPCGDYVTELLGLFSRRVMTNHIVSVTESLASASDKRALLERWQECLARLPNICGLSQSSVWYEFRPCVKTNALDGHSSTFSNRHQILLRVWVLRNLNMAIASGHHLRQAAPAVAIYNLLRFYDKISGLPHANHLLAALVKGIHELDIPPCGLLLAAVEAMARRPMVKGTRRYLGLLEAAETSFTDMFADTHAYSCTRRHFFPEYDSMIRQIDVASPLFADHAISLARNGTSKSVWLLVRLLRNHTPLKIAISRSWDTPHPAEMALVRWNPEPRTSSCPDPHACLHLIHGIAFAFAGSENLSPVRAYHLVLWLYQFLMAYNAPVKPAVVRALYHAGVVRYRRAGAKVTKERYDYIIGLVRRFEKPDVAKRILEPQMFE